MESSKSGSSIVTEKEDPLKLEQLSNYKPSVDVKNYKTQIVWRNVIYLSLLQVLSMIGLYQCFASANWRTSAFAFALWVYAKIGVIAGAHRLWSHRSYKATWQLRTILAIGQSMGWENSAFEWARDHRIHHKYSETDADPHNAKRGFFFAHIGWLMSRKHPDVVAKGKQTDLKDLYEDKVCMFQHNNYTMSVILLAFLLPTLVPWYFWGESLINSFLICGLLKTCIAQHGTWLVNSAAHLWGRRPYDKNINPSENRGVSVMTLGEGFHNFHHTFPFDYSASELGYDLNFISIFIDFFALFGWAYDRKVVSPEMIKARKLRTGDIHERGPYGPY